MRELPHAELMVELLSALNEWWYVDADTKESKEAWLVIEELLPVIAPSLPPFRARGSVVAEAAQIHELEDVMRGTGLDLPPCPTWEEMQARMDRLAAERGQ